MGSDTMTGSTMHARTGQVAGTLAPARTGETVLVDEDTRFQHVRITRHPQFGGQLYLDGDLQISESDSAYGVAMASPLLQLPRLERVAILGGGDGGVLSELLRSLEPLGPMPAAIDMIEIDARVIELSREFLPGTCGDAFDSPHANVMVGDAFAWVERAGDLDAVVYDLTMDPVREGQDRAEFIDGIIARIAAALRPGGVLSMQCCGHGLHDAGDRATRREILPQIRTAVDRHFGQRCEQDVLVPSYRDLWTFLSARKPA